jgi:hypothetical protein
MALSEKELEQAHHTFSVQAFNGTWDLIDDAEQDSDHRTEAMLHSAHASVWHWMQRKDCEDRNLSIGYWLLSRVYALNGEFTLATRFAHRCQAVSEGLSPFLVGYGHEALARAAWVAGDLKGARAELVEAKKCLEAVGQADEQEALAEDLDALANELDGAIQED